MTSWGGRISSSPRRALRRRSRGCSSSRSSINLAKISQHPQLPGRAAEALVLLAGVLASSTLGLVPGQTRGQLGAELTGSPASFGSRRCIFRRVWDAAARHAPHVDRDTHRGASARRDSAGRRGRVGPRRRGRRFQCSAGSGDAARLRGELRQRGSLARRDSALATSALSPPRGQPRAERSARHARSSDWRTDISTSNAASAMRRSCSFLAGFIRREVQRRGEIVRSDCSNT